MPTAKEALQILTEGNTRFVAGQLKHPNLTEQIRIDTYENGQKPFCAILSCADSRAPVELIFDQGIGDIFSVRNAGNTADEGVQGSLELGVYKFGIPLLMVMGHTDCGAIKCAIDDTPLKGEMVTVINRIKPIVTETRHQKPDLSGEELIIEVTVANARYTATILAERSEVLRKMIASGELTIVAALHDLKSGKVEWLE